MLPYFLFNFIAGFGEPRIAWAENLANEFMRQAYLYVMRNYPG